MKRLKNKRIVKILSLCFILIAITIVFIVNSFYQKNHKYDKKIKIGKEVITYNDSNLNLDDLVFIEIDEQGRYVFKAKDKNAYYYVNMKTRDFIYSEY